MSTPPSTARHAARESAPTPTQLSPPSTWLAYWSAPSHPLAPRSASCPECPLLSNGVYLTADIITIGQSSSRPPSLSQPTSSPPPPETPQALVKPQSSPPVSRLRGSCPKSMIPICCYWSHETHQFVSLSKSCSTLQSDLSLLKFHTACLLVFKVIITELLLIIQETFI